MANRLLSYIALIILVIAVVYYLVYHGCDQEKEHDDITCQDVFLLTIFPLISVAKIHSVGMLASWGMLDFKSALRHLFDYSALNTSLHFTSPNVTLLPVTVTQWVINGFQVYCYTPNDVIQLSNQPLLIFFHGGGGARLSPMEYDASMRYLSNMMGIKIISPHYPRSPEYVFPTAHEEYLKIVIHIFEKCDEYGVDPTRVSIGGDSFGGHASLYVAFKWRELGYNDMYAPILTLSLVYPWVQFVNFNLESFQRKENSPRLLSKSYLATYTSLLFEGSLELYDVILESRLSLLGRDYKDRKASYPLLLPDVDWQPADSMVEDYSLVADKVLDPYGTLLFQPDYTDLPPTIIVNAEYDILLTEGQLLRDRMIEAGLEVEYLLSEKMHHGFFTMVPPVHKLNSIIEAYEKISEFLHRFIDTRK